MFTIDYHSPAYIDRATGVILRAASPTAFHNQPGARKVTLRCGTHRIGPGGVLTTARRNQLLCTWRTYGARRANRRRPLLLRLDINVTAVRVAHARTHVWEDLSFRVREQETVELRGNPQD